MESYRKYFPVLENHVYLAACSHSPLWDGIERSMEKYRNDLYEFGNPWDLWVEQMEYSKGLFASLIGAKKNEVAIHYSVSSALTALLSGMKYEDRNEILVSDMEYPTTNFIFLAQERLGARTRTIKNKNHKIELEQYEKNISDKTKMVSAIHVASMNGFKQNIREISKIVHNSGSLLYVDVYQSLGTTPVDVRRDEIDFLSSGTLKWLLGVPGVAYLYVKEDLIQNLEPTNIGWFSQKNPFLFGAEKLDYSDNADRFQSGTWSVPAVYSAIEGMELIKKIGSENINSKIRDLTNFALDYANTKGLSSISPEDSNERGAIVSFLIKDPHGVENKLRKMGIITSSRDIGLRIAPHFYNTKQEIEVAIDHISSLAQGK
ncbi:MAG: aminotransferase class V-fold PLP-dependent enzyme [Candidatus Methanomethylicaceae archaeon]